MEQKICHSCGRSLKEFQETAILGCSDCYKTFESEILSALKKIQGRSFHVGKKPAVLGIDKQLLAEYRMLLSQRERATIERRFEDMAKISSDISMLLKELKIRGLV